MSHRESLTMTQPAQSAIPADIAELVLRIGRAEWGQTFSHDADGHAAHIAESVKLTAEEFGQDGPQHMHGLYIEGTETVICHTGTSPNSPQIARTLTGAWNRLHDQAAAQSSRADDFSELRDYFAGQAVVGLSMVSAGDANYSLTALAVDAYRIADFMLVVRSREYSPA